MHLSFGMETAATSTLWADVARGPSRSDVIAHVKKIGNYQVHAAPRRDARVLAAQFGSRPEAAVNSEARIAA